MISDDKIGLKPNDLIIEAYLLVYARRNPQGFDH